MAFLDIFGAPLRWLTKRKDKIMTLDERIAADQAAVANAQAQLDSLNAVLAANVSKKLALDAAESAINALGDEGVKTALLQTVAAGRVVAE